MIRREQMNHHHPNYISFPILKSELIENKNSYGFLKDTDNGEIYWHDVITINTISSEEVPILNLALDKKFILTIFMVVSLCIGSFFKCIMYRYSVTSTK